MRKQILKSLFVIGAVVVSTAAVTQAAFTDTVTVQNNTFTTGSLDLMIHYDESYTSNTGADLCNVSGAFDVDATGDGYIVNCDNPNDERVALNYGFDSLQSGEDWTTAFHWYNGLSSAVDYTNTYPGWETNTGVGYISASSAVPNVTDGNLLALGNAGTVPMEDITMTVTTELEDAGDTFDTLEPLDGAFPGGDNVDPLVDSAWDAAGLAYQTDLADEIYVLVERVSADEATVIEEVYSGTLSGLVTAGATSVLNTTVNPADLAADEVTYVKFNWELPNTVDETDASKVFDFTVEFNSTT